MILTNEMVVASLRFHAAKLWERIDDSMIFAVRLPDGENGYCCVMGNGGEYYGLGFYRGVKGFSTYLKNMSAGGQDPKEQFELFQTFDCINCNMVNASDKDLDKTAKETIKKIVAGLGLKIGRPNGWPVFIRMDHGTMKTVLDNPQDADDITLALNAAAEVGKKVGKADEKRLSELGFDAMKDYVPVEGGKKIPLLLPREDGTYEWTLTESPALFPDEYPEVVYDNEIVARQLKAAKHSGVYQFRMVHLPTPLGNRSCSYFPKVLLGTRNYDQFMMPISATDQDGGDSDLLYLHELATSLLSSGICPDTIEVVDKLTENLLADFCRQTGIKLKVVKQLDDLDDAWGFLFHCM